MKNINELLSLDLNQIKDEKELDAILAFLDQEIQARLPQQQASPPIPSGIHVLPPPPPPEPAQSSVKGQCGSRQGGSHRSPLRQCGSHLARPPRPDSVLDKLSPESQIKI